MKERTGKAKQWQRLEVVKQKHWKQMHAKKRWIIQQMCRDRKTSEHR